VPQREGVRHDFIRVVAFEDVGVEVLRTARADAGDEIAEWAVSWSPRCRGVLYVLGALDRDRLCGALRVENLVRPASLALELRDLEIIFVGPKSNTAVCKFGVCP
jgi:hypothetical protein